MERSIIVVIETMYEKDIVFNKGWKRLIGNLLKYDPESKNLKEVKILEFSQITAFGRNFNYRRDNCGNVFVPVSELKDPLIPPEGLFVGTGADEKLYIDVRFLLEAIAYREDTNSASNNRLAVYKRIHNDISVKLFEKGYGIAATTRNDCFNSKRSFEIIKVN